MEMNEYQSLPLGVPSTSTFASSDPFELPGLSDHKKRALLASWASDANAVPHLPTLRQLPNGSIARVADILRSLKALDARRFEQPDERRRRRETAGRVWFRLRNRNDDDDDPPPCPALAAVPPRSGGGAEFAFPELEPVAA